MIPFLNIKLTTALAVFVATLATAAGLSRLQAAVPSVRQLTGGQSGSSSYSLVDYLTLKPLRDAFG